MKSLFRTPKKECKIVPFEGKDGWTCLFCGGQSCKHCGMTAYLALERPAIDKLHSTWISDSIIAMQRPNDKLILNNNLIEQFKRNRITSIFNLTEPGEHPNCGVGISPKSGFSYSPEYFMNAGINHFNFSWRDLTVPTIDLMLNIVHVAVNEICKGGKIAVHCHAGYGRTGTAIACILIAIDDLTVEEAINIVRNRRPGSIQTLEQEKFVQLFESSYKNIINVFPIDLSGKVLNKNIKTFSKSLQDQFFTLSFEEISVKYCKNINKIMFNAMPRYSNYLNMSNNPKKIDILVTSFSGLCYNDMNILEYNQDFHLLNINFINTIINEININNWTTFIDITVFDYSISDVDHAVILGLFPENVIPSIDNTINHSLNVISQLVLHYIETRSNNLFDDKLISSLRSIWLSEEDGSISNKRKMSMTDTRDDSSMSYVSSTSRSTSYGLLPDIKNNKRNLSIAIDKSDIMDLSEIEIVFKYIDDYLRKTLNRFELFLLQVLLNLIKMIGQSKEELTPLFLISLDNNYRNYINLYDLLSLRLAIALTKGNIRCNNILTNNREISLDLIKYFNSALEKSGFSKLVSIVIVKQSDIFDESVLSDISVIWKTLLFLSNHNWKYYKPKNISRNTKSTNSSISLLPIINVNNNPK